jgi:hypothetical protein
VASGHFHESTFVHKPIRDLGLTIAGTRLEPIVGAFLREVRAAGLAKIEPRLYLSTEWGVPFGTAAIAIPFYLAHPELAHLHVERTGMVEGFEPTELVRYLRHELGHVINYAYRLFDRADWVSTFGAISQPYIEEYRPQPFDSRFVRHLPGWYAQKHPDEDWAETFAVWMTPGHDWSSEYAQLPEALAKLRLCDALMAEVRGREPLPLLHELDEDVATLGLSLEELYRAAAVGEPPDLPPGIDGSLRALFPGDGDVEGARLLLRLQATFATDLYRWTGYFPERGRLLVRALAARVAALDLAYRAADEAKLIVGLTTLITALAMSYVQRMRPPAPAPR